MLNESTMITSSGTAIFHHVIALFVVARSRTPRKLMVVKIAIRITAITMPVAVRTPFSGFTQLCAQL